MSEAEQANLKIFERLPPDEQAKALAAVTVFRNGYGAESAAPVGLNIDIKNPKTKDFLVGLAYCGFSFRLNLLDDTVEVNNKPLSEMQEAIIFNKMRDIGLSATSRIRYAWLEAAQSSAYHPLQEWLTSLQWDGNDHIKRLVTKYLTDTTGFAHVAFQRWFIGAVAKVFEQAQNFVLVWDGPQGAGKSALARWLCPIDKYFHEGGINPADKDDMLRSCQLLVWEIGELQATTRKADREALKDFVVRQVVKMRRAYARYDLEKPQSVSFIGTINEDGAGFLNDPTGSRRFVILNLKEINWSYAHELDPSQLWAQAVALYQAGESWKLTPQERQKQEEINAQYQVQSLTEQFFWDSFTIDLLSDDYSTVTKILTTLETMGLKQPQQMTQRELSRLMKRLNVNQIRAVEGDKRPRAYRGVLRK